MEQKLKKIYFYATKNNSLAQRSKSNKYIPIKNDSINYESLFDINTHIRQVHLTLDGGITNRKNKKQNSFSIQQTKYNPRNQNLHLPQPYLKTKRGQQKKSFIDIYLNNSKFKKNRKEKYQEGKKNINSDVQSNIKIINNNEDGDMGEIVGIHGQQNYQDNNQYRREQEEGQNVNSKHAFTSKNRTTNPNIKTKTQQINKKKRQKPFNHYKNKQIIQQQHQQQPNIDHYINQYLFDLVNQKNIDLREQIQQDRQKFIQQAIKKIKRKMKQQMKKELLNKSVNKRLNMDQQKDNMKVEEEDNLNGQNQGTRGVEERKHKNKKNLKSQNEDFQNVKKGHSKNSRCFQLIGQNRTLQKDKRLSCYLSAEKLKQTVQIRKKLKQQRKNKSKSTQLNHSSSPITLNSTINPQLRQKQKQKKSSKNNFPSLSNTKTADQLPFIPSRKIYASSPTSQFITKIGKTFYINQLNLLNKTVQLQAKNRDRAQRVFKRKLMNIQKQYKKSLHDENDAMDSYY